MGEIGVMPIMGNTVPSLKNQGKKVKCIRKEGKLESFRILDRSAF